MTNSTKKTLTIYRELEEFQVGLQQRTAGEAFAQLL